MSSTNDSARGTVVLSDIRKISQRGKKKAQDGDKKDSKKLETLKRSSFRGTKSGILSSSLKRQLSSRGLREQEVLREARRLIENNDWLSEVMEVVDVKGQRVMWLTVPQELKDKYNCTDMKCYDQWLKRVWMDINQFKPGMKLRMKVTSVSVRGKFGNQPIIRGIPCSAKSPRNNQELLKAEKIFRSLDAKRQSVPQNILVAGRPQLSPRKAQSQIASPILNGPSPRFMNFLRQREGPAGRGSYQEHLGYVKKNRLSRPSTPQPHPAGFRRSHHDFRIAHSPRTNVVERFSRNTKSGIQLSRFSCSSPLNAKRRDQKARGH